MSPQRLGDLLHRVDLRSHSSSAPAVEEFPRPVGGDVAPKELKVLFEQVASDRLEVVAQQISQLDVLGGSEILGAFEQPPSTALEHRHEPLGLELTGFGGSYLVDRLIDVGDDMEAVKDMDGLWSFLRQHLQVGLPHVAANELQLCAALFAELSEESQQSPDGAFFADPQEALASGVDLVDKGQVAVASMPLDLIDTDRFDTVEISVIQAPLDDIVNSSEDGLPTGTESLGDIGPSEQACPLREEQGVGSCQRRLALCPRDALDPDAALGAIDAPHGVDEDDGNGPQRHEVEASRCAGVVAWASASAARTNGSSVGPRSDLDLKDQLLAVGAQNDLFVDERRKLVESVEYSLDQHSALFWWMRC